jgi:DNA (cytosine-5)-methyltransferase 1
VNSGLKTVGLFAGIGGIELGLQESGHNSQLLCELDPAAAKVLKHRFLDVPLHPDICTLKDIPSDTELLCAGFPCQDLSQAGKTAGIEGSRSGLVGEVFRLLRKRRVPWVFLENVPFMLQLSKGRAMEVIVASLEELGYRWAYRVMDSRSFGVPQRRRRVYLIASLHEDPRSVLLSSNAEAQEEGSNWRSKACGFYWTEGIRGLGWGFNAVPTLKGGSTVGIASPPAIVLPNGTVGKPELRDAERLQGFAPDWTLPAEEVVRRGFRWKLVGNAVTVGAARWIGERLRDPIKYQPILDANFSTARAWPDAAWNVCGVRYYANLSPFPIMPAAPDLFDFLRYPLDPLSIRATRGFLERTTRSSLRFPPGFLDVLRSHLEQMEQSMLAA